MSTPHVWLREQIEAATDATAWPVEAAGSAEPPYVVYVRDETSRDVAMTLETAIGQEAPAFRVATFVVTIYCDSYAQGWEIAEDISAAVHNVSGGSGHQYIQQSKVMNERDGAAGYMDGRDQPTYTIDITVEIQYEG